jgi:hypothetical protein
MNEDLGLPRISLQSKLFNQSFPDVLAPIYWGPAQNTSNGFYVEPTGWNELSLAVIPKVVRFNYDSNPINTDDYAAPVPPPPPPPSQTRLAWLILRTVQLDPGTCPNGDAGVAITWGLLGSPDGVSQGGLIQVRGVTCCTTLTACACYPDCTFGGTEGDPDNPQDYQTYIYSYPCGHYPPYPNGGFADQCPQPNEQGFGGTITGPSGWGGPLPEWP